MQRKKIDFTKRSKLSAVDDQSTSYSAPLEIIPTKSVALTHSFRLRAVDVERLNAALNKANSENNTVIFNRTDLIRGLIMLAQNTSAKQLLDVIRGSI